MCKIIQAQLENYLIKFPQESATVDTFENYLSQSNRTTCNRDRIRVSAWIFNPINGKILLAHHKKTNKWTQLRSQEENYNLHFLKKISQQSDQKEFGVQTLQLLTPDLFNIRIHLQRKLDASYYLYDFCYIYSTSEDLIRTNITEYSETRWVTIAEIISNKKYHSIKQLAMKWQLICDEKMAAVK